jgi:hypothetical protein
MCKKVITVWWEVCGCSEVRFSHATQQNFRYGY